VKKHLDKRKHRVIINIDEKSKKWSRFMRKILAILGFFWLVLSLTPAGSLAQIAGDANGDSAVNAADVVYQINYLFVNGPPPVFYECGDPNVDCQINSADVAYLINYLFIGGPSPQITDSGM
jgi:hypothetical protein